MDLSVLANLYFLPTYATLNPFQSPGFLPLIFKGNNSLHITILEPSPHPSPKYPFHRLLILSVILSSPQTFNLLSTTRGSPHWLLNTFGSLSTQNKTKTRNLRQTLHSPMATLESLPLRNQISQELSFDLHPSLVHTLLR